MSSKRLLYKPATEENVGQLQKRKPLAQGRLVNKPLLPQTGGVLSSTLNKEDAANKSVENSTAPVTYSPQRRNVPTPRKDLSALMRTNLTTSHQDESQLDPRREIPSASIVHSPHQAYPSQALDISDTDSETAYSYKKRHSPSRHDAPNSPPDVLMVDASRQTKGPDESEVDITVGYHHSPARVVCHSPAKVHSDIRDTSGSVEENRKVQVDSIPRVRVLTSEGSFSLTEQSGGHTHFKSPLVVRESTIAGSSIDKSSLSKPVAHQLFPEHFEDDSEQTDSFPGNQGSLGLRRLSESSQDASDQISETSDAPPPKVKVTSGAPRAKSVTLSQEDIRDKMKKKKATRVVASRYMQTIGASTTKGPMKATDRTVLGKSKLSKSTDTSMDNKKPSLAPKRLTNSAQKMKASPARKKVVLSAPRAKRSINVSGFSTTPEAPGQGGKASTPTIETSVFLTPDGVDVSAIAPLKQTLRGRSNSGAVDSGHSSSGSLSLKKSLGHTLSQGAGKDSGRDSQLITSVGSGHEATHVKKRSSGEVGQFQLDLLYARYLQTLFLESKAKKAFQEQEKEVMKQIHGLWDENEKLRQRKADSEMQLVKLKHVNMLEEALELQQSGLSPVASTLPQLRQQYSTLARALDTTRHQIPTKGVYIPDDEDTFHDTLTAALHESEQLLGELSVMIRQKQPKVKAFADAIGTVENIVDQEVKELDRCKELLSAVQSLTTKESSLQIQEIQAIND